MGIRFKILESARQIKNSIVNSIKEEVADLLGKKRRKVRESIQVIVYNAVYNSVAMRSVRGGILEYELGLDFDPTEAIADAVSRSIDIEVTKPRKGVDGPLGGYTVRVQPKDYLNVLNLPEAVQITEKGDTLPWLDWLLTYGDEVIIADFRVLKKPGAGRSGGGIMVATDDSNLFFQINRSFQGTEDNNFISRAIKNAGPLINAEILRILK